MNIAVTTPTGNIGSVIARRLLDEGADVTLLVRDPAKVQELVDRGAEVRQGELQDRDFVAEATAGVDALFWLSPPTVVENFLETQRSYGEAGAAAARINAIPRVVHLSSVGAQHPSGNGPVSGLHHIENLFDDAAPNVTHLRAGYFMENFLYHVDAIKGMGSVFMTVDPEVRLPMVATRDIGEVAARRLLDDGWTGHQRIGVHGPADLNHIEAAEALSEALGRNIDYVQVTPEQAHEALSSMGLPDGAIAAMLELYDGMSEGRMESAEPRTAETTTPTTLTEWASEVLRPAVES